MNEYTPKIIEEKYNGAYGEMLVELQRCPICQKYMIVNYENRYSSTFPHYKNLDFNAQIKAAGWVKKSYAKIDDKYICEVCKESGKASFTCALCAQRHSMDKIQDSFGDPPELLCKNCYEITPAKLWDEKVNTLRDAHKYDFE